ncbi:hypothetical protein C8Q78DRAFT_1075516 [Trametes maxima]|nr:hypothetical protein C8Q78DRAFT_1075516 [Trametes maxima]
MPLDLPTEIFRIPVYVCLPARDRDGLPKQVLLSVVLHMLGNQHLQAFVDVDHVTSEDSVAISTVPIVKACDLPDYVDAFYPPNVLENPIYFVIHDPPTLTFPNRLRIAVAMLEYNPGDHTTFTVTAKLEWMAPAHTTVTHMLPFTAAQPFGLWAGTASQTSQAEDLELSVEAQASETR